VSDFEKLKALHEGPAITYRVISTAYPSIYLYDDLDVDPDEWETLYEIEAMTNPRMRNETGKLELVTKPKHIAKEGLSFIMSPFTHINPEGSRFSDGSYGIYYCAKLEETAAREVAHHRTKFMKNTNESAQTLVFRTIKATLEGKSFNLTKFDWPWLKSENYSECRKLGKYAREKIDFLHYNAVRHPEHTAYAVFQPHILKNAKHLRYLEMYWDGEKITHESKVGIIF
jgi:hypothetical protein